MDLPEDLPLVSVDPVLFEQVFVNLLDNAVKYTPAGSPFEIGARRVERRARDRGGRPRARARRPARRQRIFEKF